MKNSIKRKWLLTAAILCVMSIAVIVFSWNDYQILASLLQLAGFSILLYVEYKTKNPFKLDVSWAFLLAGFGLNLGMLLGGIFRAATS